MTPEEVQHFAIQITFTNNRTFLKMKDGTEIVGHFGSGDFDSINTNDWQFYRVPAKENEEYLMINGNDIASIEIRNN